MYGCTTEARVSLRRTSSTLPVRPRRWIECDDSPACHESGELGRYGIGAEQEGHFEAIAEGPRGAARGEATVELAADGCHVETQELMLVLE